MLHAGIDIFAKTTKIRKSFFKRFTKATPCNDENTKQGTEDDGKIIADISTMSEAKDVSDMSFGASRTTLSRSSEDDTDELAHDKGKVSDETLKNITLGRLNPEAPGFDGSMKFYKTPETSLHPKED
jgi:hypothetical protein